MKYEIKKPVRRNFLDLFDRVFDEDFFVPSTNLDNSWTPAIDVLEKEDRYIVKADLPGVSEKDIDVELKDDILTIRGERKSEYKEEKDNVHRCERFYGSFSRSFNVSGINSDKISADYNKGILTVELPKAEEKKSKKITVKSS